MKPTSISLLARPWALNGCGQGAVEVKRPDKCFGFSALAESVAKHTWLVIDPNWRLPTRQLAIPSETCSHSSFQGHWIRCHLRPPPAPHVRGGRVAEFAEKILRRPSLLVVDLKAGDALRIHDPAVVLEVQPLDRLDQDPPDATQYLLRRHEVALGVKVGLHLLSEAGLSLHRPRHIAVTFALDKVLLERYVSKDSLEKRLVPRETGVAVLACRYSHQIRRVRPLKQALGRGVISSVSNSPAEDALVSPEERQPLKPFSVVHVKLPRSRTVSGFYTIGQSMETASLTEQETKDDVRKKAA